MPLLIALALAAAPAVAAVPPAGAERLLQDCSAHRFETSISVTSNGVPRQSKVKVCGTAGQSDAAWIGTLKDTIAKVEGNPKMPPSARQQIVAAVTLEIVRLGGTVAASAAPPPALVNAPPLPAPRAVVATNQPVYSALPPFPPQVTAQPGTALAGLAPAAAAAPYVAPLPRPKISFTCYSDGDIGAGGPCFAFERGTLITVRAGEPLKNTILRFVRDGDARADVPLIALAKGRTTRFALPREVCAHAVGGKLSIRIVRGPTGRPDMEQVVGTEGPYNLRC